MLVKRQDVAHGGEYFAANAHGNSEAALDLLRNRDMLRIEDWSYEEGQSSG